jgi:hypothetical protein
MWNRATSAQIRYAIHRVIGRLRSGLVFAQNRDDLPFGEPDPLHPRPLFEVGLSLRVEEKLSGKSKPATDASR